MTNNKYAGWLLLDDALKETPHGGILALMGRNKSLTARKAFQQYTAGDWNPVQGTDFAYLLNGKESTATQAKVYVRPEWSRAWPLEVAPAPGALPKAPPIIELEDRDYFRDAEGNAIIIEIRGDPTRKDEKTWFFKNTDVSVGFGYPRDAVRKRMLDPTSVFSRDSHFVTFEEGMYLTWDGFMLWLDRCHAGAEKNTTVTAVKDWIRRVVHVVRNGNDEDRVELAQAVVLNNVRSIAGVAELFGRGGRLAALYKWLIGNVGELRHILTDIPTEIGGRPVKDTARVYKFGYSENFAERGSKYSRDIDAYLSEPISHRFQLEKFVIVGSNMAAAAERRFKNDFLRAFPYRFRQRCTLASGEVKELTEFLVIPTEADLKKVKEEYDFFSRAFSGDAAGLQQLVDQLTHERDLKIVEVEAVRTQLRLEVENARKDVDIAKKDVDIARKDVEVRDIQIDSLREKIDILNERIATVKDIQK